MVVENSEHFMMTQPNGIVNCNVIRCVHLWCSHYHREILTRVVRPHLIHSKISSECNDALSFLAILIKVSRVIQLHGLMAIKIIQTFIVLNSNLAYSLQYQSIRTDTSYNSATGTEQRLKKLLPQNLSKIALKKALGTPFAHFSLHIATFIMIHFFEISKRHFDAIRALNIVCMHDLSWCIIISIIPN